MNYLPLILFSLLLSGCTGHVLDLVDQETKSTASCTTITGHTMSPANVQINKVRINAFDGATHDEKIAFIEKCLFVLGKGK